MSEPFIGEIRIFAENFVPQGWFPCNGQSLPISKYMPLFAVIGTKYGSNGRKNFSLPDLRGCAPMGHGQCPGLTNQTIGKSGGTNAVTLNPSQIPSHTHSATATNAAGMSNDPTGRIWAAHKTVLLYSSTNNNPVRLSGNVLGTSVSRDTEAHDNVQPYLGINFAIAWEGIFPTRA